MTLWLKVLYKVVRSGVPVNFWLSHVTLLIRQPGRSSGAEADNQNNRLREARAIEGVESAEARKRRFRSVSESTIAVENDRTIERKKYLHCLLCQLLWPLRSIVLYQAS